MVEQALQGGARTVQYRHKKASAALRLEQAKALNQLVRQYQGIFLVNDDPALAQDCGAHGVHLGQSDNSLQQARALLGDKAIIGISCHDSMTLALEAQQEGADYVALGRFYPSQTKPDAPQASLQQLQMIRQKVDLPLVAIGGILPQHLKALIGYGADAVAVVQGLFAAQNVSQRAQQYSEFFS